MADEQFLSDQGPFAASYLDVVQWHDYEIRVPLLALQLEVSRQRGLTERSKVIERALLCPPVGHDPDESEGAR